MQPNNLYENRVVTDEEFPLQLSVDTREAYEVIFTPHWHEDIELHYIVSGEADFYLNQTCYHAVPGDLLVVNANEMHSGICTCSPYCAEVAIFDIGNLSPELAKENYIFYHQIAGDQTIAEIYRKLFEEVRGKRVGYKQMCRSLSTELLVYLCRQYADRVLREREGLKRRKDLERLNVVLRYIEEHYMEPVTVEQLAQMIYLSPDRFGHLFRESVGKPPLQYLNERRLRQAMTMLKTGEYTVTEVSEAVGFRDYNHFGRLFRKQYNLTPHEVQQGKLPPAIIKSQTG